MKLFLAFVLMLGSFAAQALILPVNRSTSLQYDGSFLPGSREQHYINVVNRDAATYAIGSVVVWDSGNDDGYSVIGSVTAGAFPACMLVVSCAQNKLCKCQTYGYTDVLLLDAGHIVVSAGANIFINETVIGKVQGEIFGSIAATDHSIGMFYDTVSTSGAVEAFLKF